LHLSTKIYADILCANKKGLSEILVNRAVIIANIVVDKYNYNIGAALNKDKKLEIIIENAAKRCTIILENASWMKVRKNKGRFELTLYGRHQLLPLLEWLKNE